MNPSTAALSIQRIGLATSSTPTFRAAHGLGDVRKLHPRRTFTPPPFRLPPGMSPRDHTTESRLSHRGQRSLSTPALDLRSPRDRSQTPTATDMAVHWWRLAGNSTDPADLALVAPRERARPNRPNTPRTQPNSPTAGRGCGTSGRGPRGSAGRHRAGADTPARAGRGPGRPTEHPRHPGVHDVTVPGPRTATAAAPFGVPTRVALSPHPEVRQQIPRPVPPPHGLPPAISRSRTHP